MRTSYRSTRALGITTALGLAIAGLLAMPTAASAATGLPVTGYQVEADATSLIDASAPALGSVGVDGVNITPDGAGVPAPSAAALRQLAQAHANGLPAEFLVGNFSATLNDFDETAAYNLLNNADAINSVVASLADSVASQGWDGVTIDLESLQARDRTGLSTFATALKQALPPGKTLSIDLTNCQSLSAYDANGYDLAALGHTVDRLVLMAYDEHGFATTAGPVGELSWQSTGLDVLLGQVDPGTVDLGVAGYGYDWAANGTVTQVSDQGARDLVSANGVTAAFDTSAGEWNAALPDGSVLWWSDAQSLTARRNLAAGKGIHGLAMWDLGLSDPVQP
jgi:spore germination protein YaaH